MVASVSVRPRPLNEELAPLSAPAAGATMSAGEVESFLRELGCCPAGGALDRSLPAPQPHEPVPGRRDAWRPVLGIVSFGVGAASRAATADRWQTREIVEWARLRLACAPAGGLASAAAVALVAQLHSIGSGDAGRVIAALTAAGLQPAFASHLHAWLVHHAPLCRPLILRSFIVDGSPIDGVVLAACGPAALPTAVHALEIRSQDRQCAAAAAIFELVRRGARLADEQLQAVHRVALSTTSEGVFGALAVVLEAHGQPRPAWLRRPGERVTKPRTTRTTRGTK